MADKQAHAITYKELSLHPMNQRERILQEWLVRWSWELLGSQEVIDVKD
jgi:hypothetical protein